jgi:WD40 repeat protein
MLVVWDSHSGIPVRTFLNPHPNGVRCMDLSKDNQYIVTIGAETEDQTVSLWDWTNEQETGPIVSMQIRAGLSQSNPMHWIKFNPDDPFEIATNSGKRLLFLSWSLGVSKFEYYSPSISKGDYNSKGSYNAAYTKTVFIPGTEMAVTGTESGDILVFDRSLIIEGIGEQNEKRIIKIVTLNQKQTPIT